MSYASKSSASGSARTSTAAPFPTPRRGALLSWCVARRSVCQRRAPAPPWAMRKWKPGDLVTIVTVN